MTIEYSNVTLTVPIGSKDAVLDLQLSAVEGYVYRLTEVDLILIKVAAETASSFLTTWLSVDKDGRSTFAPWGEGFQQDVLAFKVYQHTPASLVLKGVPIESPNEGYVINDPYFQDTVRIGASLDVNAAGASVGVFARIAAERVKSTQVIQQIMYTRSQT